MELRSSKIAVVVGLAPLLMLGLAACSSDEDVGHGAATGGATSSAGGTSSGDGGTASGGAHAGTGASASSGGRTSASGGQGGSGANPRSGCKRGVAYGEHSKADFAVLSPAVAWWYDWATRPDQALRDGSYRDAQVEFVPMIWGEGSLPTAAGEIPDDAEVLLGFNEPNFGEQANLSASQAAALWPQVEAIADAKGLVLVSPAVNFCGGACQDTNPFDYLDDFFAACAGCRVDKVAFHIYVGCNKDGANKAQWLINHVETYKERFSQPLWLTEFACDDAASFAEQEAFMRDAVAYLENEPRIERYAWFSGRFQHIPYVDLLGEDGVLTSLGQVYVDAPKSAACAE